MPELKIEKLEEYLTKVYKSPVKVSGVYPLRGGRVVDVKGFGYGVPYLIEFTIEGRLEHVIFETLSPGGLGRDFFSDRAGILLWQHSVFNKLPNHVHSVDVGSFLSDGETLLSLGNCTEFFLLREFVEGSPYQGDLDRIKNTFSVTDQDEERCVALSDYLVGIHSVKKDAPELYLRRVRDLLGYGEGIFGLTDGYPGSSDYVDEKYLLEIEKSCLEWRWHLRHKVQRLSQVHGDFHPHNILFKEGEVEFTVLGRSIDEWGEPAEDVAAMTMNYIFHSLKAFEEMNGPYGRLFILFWKNYLDKTGDDEILKVIQPFYAWRSLAMASPLRNPHLTSAVRKKILRFGRKVLDAKDFEFESVSTYIR